MAVKKNNSDKAPKPVTLPLHAAYARVLRTTGIWNVLKWNRQSVHNYRVKLGKGEYPSVRAMRRVLSEAGWRLAVEETWTDEPKPRRSVGPRKKKA